MRKKRYNKNILDGNTIKKFIVDDNQEDCKYNTSIHPLYRKFNFPAGGRHFGYQELQSGRKGLEVRILKRSAPQLRRQDTIQSPVSQSKSHSPGVASRDALLHMQNFFFKENGIMLLVPANYCILFRRIMLIEVHDV